MNIHEKFEWKRLVDDPKHVFFGYYDRVAWDEANEKHLALRVNQCERLPEIGEKAEVGYVERRTNRFVPVAETRAWCHQQGAMTLWLKHKMNTFVYNDVDEKSGQIRARLCQIGEGVVDMYERPIYAMSPDGRWAASLDFSRIPRRGYSYAEALLPDNPRPDLDDDGLFLMDLHSGESRLLVSYRQLYDLHPMRYDLDECRWWLNHAIFNCDSSKLLFLFRNTGEGDDAPWITNMYTVNVDGSDLACTLPHFYWNGMISHQIWGRTSSEVLIDANWRGKGFEYVVFDNDIRPLQGERISKGMGPMGHLVFSPDGKYMLADTYPSYEQREMSTRRGFQRLALVDVATGGVMEIGTFKHDQPTSYPVDVRCDLHPRWSADGSLITVDTIHEGRRSIYMIELSQLLK